MAHLVGCSTWHSSQGEWLRLGVVAALVGGLLGLCLPLPGLSFKRKGVVRAVTAVSWCTLDCGRSPCPGRERHWGGVQQQTGTIGFVWWCSAASNHRFLCTRKFGWSAAS